MVQVHLVEAEGGQCLALVGDVGDPQACQRAVETTIKAFEQLDILVNNAAEQVIDGFAIVAYSGAAFAIGVSL
jgi:NAD(P)-dependent dehydrogenase (short-subunit alcohol dehydrogenase family)